MAYEIDPYEELEQFLPEALGVHHPDAAVKQGDSPLSPGAARSAWARRGQRSARMSKATGLSDIARPEGR